MMTSRSAPDLFTPLQAGAFRLGHRVVMPALTRRRATAAGVPTPMMAEHYAQRASAGGLVICEAAAVTAGTAAPGMPGLYNAQQVNHWRLVTDAVHAAGGTVVAQLALDADAALALGLDPDGIERLLLDYRSAAENAGDAGFDGVELQAAHGALPERLLRGELLPCASAYRGSAEGNMRFLTEALQSLLGVWGRGRVGVCLSPERPERGRLFGKHDTMAFHALLLGALHREGIAYLHLVEPGFDGRSNPPTSARQPRVAALLRPFYPGVLIAAGGFDLPAAAAALQAGLADAVAFGRGFVANPDLPLRLRSGAALAVADQRWFYAGAAQGYVEPADDTDPAHR